MRILLLLLALLNLTYGLPQSKAPPCDPGSTGPNCQNPICTSPSSIDTHDGLVGDGDLIAWEYSFNCNEEFQFFIDEYITNVTVSAYAAGKPFNGAVYKGNRLVVPTSSETGFGGWLISHYIDMALIYGYGQYRIVLSSDGTAGCEIAVSAPTVVVIDGGFVTNRSDDYVQEIVPEPHQGVGLNPKRNVTTYFAFKMTDALGRPGRATTVTTYIVQGFEQTGNVYDRYNCAATQIAGPFHCDFLAGAYYHLKVKGIDTKGNIWQRVYPFMCEVQGTVAPPTTAAPPSECHNGGILINGGTPQAICYCGQYYEGPQCDTIRCFNGGAVGPMETCLCKVGFNGAYCQDVICTDQSTEPYSLKYRAVIFVIRTGQSMVGHIQQAVEAADRIQKFYALTDPEYIQEWMLVTVTSGAVDMTNYQDPSQFINAIRGIPVTQDTICNDVLYSGLTTVLSSSFVDIYKRSPIFIFSDGLPDDDDDTRYALLHQLSFFRGQLFFMLADSITGRCNIDTTSQEFRGMRYLAQFTHGHVVYTNLQDLAMTALALASSLYRSVYIMSNDLLDSCQRAPKYQTFFIDKSTSYFWISATGKGLNISLTAPDRTPVVVDNFWTTAPNIYIWQVSAAKIGSYLLQITSTTQEPCSLRVFSNSESALWVGVSTGVNDDVEIVQPQLNTEAHIVAFINGAEMPDTQAIHPEVTIWTNEGRSDTRTVLYASNGIYRDHCAFNLYYGAWKCLNPFQFFFINVFMTDTAGTILQRSFTGFCSPTRPTQTPPEGCLNGGMPSGGNGTCICPAHYIGNKCQTIQCLNLGTPVGGTCVCVSGFSGQFCETTTCYTKNRMVNFSPNGRSLAFLIQDSISTRTTIRHIKEQMSSLVQDMTHQHKDWISNYQLWRFNDSSFVSLTDGPDPNTLLRGLEALSLANSMNSDPSCRDLMVLPGLLSVLMHPGITARGIIYMFINGYMNVNASDMSSIVAMYEMLELTRVQLNIVLMSGSPCGQDLAGLQSSVLMNFVAFTGGQFIMVMPPKAGEVVRSIPTQYRTNFIYENYINDCSINTTNIYFPVDSQLQSFTAYIVGELDQSSVKYYRPDGSIKPPYNLWTDTGMGSRMDQIIKECDYGWELRDNRCWLFVVDKASWYIAQSQCHRSGAVLLNIYNAAEQAYVDALTLGLDYWIGLNDQADLGKWVWDVVDGTPISLESTGYKNWAAGQPDNDMNKRCVYSFTNRGWSTDNCAIQRPFICVKHAYDADYEPDEGNVGEVLARGIWKLTLKTTEGPCYVQIFAQSGIQVYSKFTTDIHQDDGIVQPLVNAEDNRMIAHVTNQISAGTGNSGQLKYAHFYQDNLTIIEAETFQMRDTSKCSYEYLSTGFRCPSSSFLSLTTGIDRFGYLYQRIQPVNCFKGPQAGECIHGTYSKGHCICDPYYTGDLCQTPICQYGTLDSVGEHCTCYPGYQGPVCNIPSCTRKGSNNPGFEPTPVNRTFVLLLDGSRTGNMEVVANELGATLKNISAELAKYPGWFTHYTGIVFRDKTVGNNSLSVTIESDDPTDFTTQILAEYATPYTPTDSKRSIMAAVVRAMASSYIQARSYVWILTAGIPEDGDRVGIALAAVARQHCYVNFLIMGDNGPPGGVQANDTMLRSCYELVIQTGGQFYQIGTESKQLAFFWTALFQNYYNAFYISTRSNTDCSQGLVEYIQLGTNTSTIIIDAVGGGQVYIADPDNNIMKMDPVASSKTNNVSVAQSYGSKPGLWKVVVPSYKGFCSVSIRGQSMLDVYIAFTHDVGGDGGVHSDEADGYPIVGDGENAVVAYSNFGRLNFAQIYSVNERGLLWSSPLVARQRCLYPYISRNVFTCTDLALAVAIEGEDDFGFPFRRMVHVHCTGTIVKTTPIPMNRTTGPPVTTTPYPTLPAPPCDPAAKLDIILMFDASEGISNDVFKRIVGAMDFFPQKTTIDPRFTRFMLGAYADTVQFATSNFNTISNSADYMSWLDVLRVYGYSGDMGNNIQDIFDSLDPTLFRQDANHTLVLFSSMGWDKTNTGQPYPDPVASAEAFRRQGGKIIPIGYGPNANRTQLMSLGISCTKMAPDVNYVLSVIAPWLMNAICSPDQFCLS